MKPNGTASPHVCVVAEDARLIHEHGLRGRTWTLVSRGPPLPVLQLDLGSRQATSYKKVPGGQRCLAQGPWLR